MKKLIVVCMALTLIVTATACNKEDAASSDANVTRAIEKALESASASASEPVSEPPPAAQKPLPERSSPATPESIPATSESIPAPPEQEEDPINRALTLIPGGERLLGDDDQNLFLLKEYGLAMAWDEANALEHLERGTSPDSVGQYDVYFLLIPKYIGSQVELSQVGYDEDKGFYPTDAIYRNLDTPDSYGLLFTSSEPEVMIELAATVTYDGISHTYFFSYDGRGDRPDVLAFPEDVDWPSTLDGEG